MNELSEKMMKKQKINLIIVSSVLIVIIMGIGNYLFSNYQTPKQRLFDAKVDLPVDDFKAKEIWMDRLEAQVNLMTQRQKYYEDTLLEYKEREQINDMEKIELKRHLARLKQEIDNSSLKIAQAESAKAAFMPVMSQSSIEENAPAANPFVAPTCYSPSSMDFQEIPEAPALRPPLCEYVMQEDKNELFSVTKRTPANVSVKALLISSVDAVCRLDAQSDPVPVKLRLLDDGYLPEGVVVKLKGCLLGASAYGDVSNERVYMRLENLTKVNAKGEAIETEVTGYVSGEDGRFGMRGTVVDRTGKILQNAAGSGILSGIAQTIQSAYTRPPQEAFNTYSIGAGFAEGAASGTSDAFTMLASYYIRRAEQVQPVLQINAGRIVDVTFTHGFSLGDINAKTNLKKIRERSRGL